MKSKRFSRETFAWVAARFPLIGVGAIVRRHGRVLLIRRTGSHGSGTWTPPGGCLEFNESPERCAARETLEETGVRIKNIRFAEITNDRFVRDRLHFITLWMTAEYAGGRACAKDPREATDAGWFRWNALPGPLFSPFRRLLHGKQSWTE